MSVWPNVDDNSSKEQRTHPLLATYEDKLDKLAKHPTFDDSIQINATLAPLCIYAVFD